MASVAARGGTHEEAAMAVRWELVRSGPEDAEHGVLLLPGGALSAREYGPLMGQPTLKGTRLVAATLPGHAGTPPPDDYSIESYARFAAELAADNSCDVVAGYSIGATVALEMAASAQFAGPVVLIGISLSPDDEPAFFRAIVRGGHLVGGWPAVGLMRLTALATRSAKVSDEHRAVVRNDLRRNDRHTLQPALSAYLDYLEKYDAPAERLCDAGVPAWVVHAEKGDGGLTDEERGTLERCPTTTLVTLPGTSWLIPEEHPEPVAATILEAVGAVGAA
jgi:pimeloyl-ACP methyl ester carboxylesterase